MSPFMPTVFAKAPRESEWDILLSLLQSPHIHHILEFCLDTNFPLWSTTQIFIQNQWLKTLLDLTSSSSSIGQCCNTLPIIQQTVQEDLFSIFHQLQMPEFIIDVERYAAEMTATTNPQIPPSTSSYRLSTAIKLAIQQVQTHGMLHRTPIDAPLSWTHPQYSKMCFECVQSVRSTTQVICNITAPLITASLVPYPCPCRLPLAHTPFLLLALTGWSLKTLGLPAITLELLLPLGLLLWSKTLIMMT